MIEKAVFPGYSITMGYGLENVGGPFLNGFLLKDRRKGDRLFGFELLLSSENHSLDEWFKKKLKR